MRSLMVDLDRFQGGQRVLLVCHDAIVMTFRYVCEGLTESQVLGIAHDDPVRNVSLTRLVREPDSTEWTLDAYNDVSHLEKRDVEVTESKGDSRAVPSEIVTPSLLRDWPLPGSGSGKRSRGNVLVVGGAAGTRAPRFWPGWPRCAWVPAGFSWPSPRPWPESWPSPPPRQG
jgi:hypothetical protein